MDFRTEFKINASENKICYEDKLLFLGSCFAENMSSYFERFRFQVKTNPFGILFHPLAIKRLIDIALDENYNPNEFSFEHQELWSNFDAHSSLSNSSKQELIDNLYTSKLKAERALKTTDVIFISLGTAWVYKHKAKNKVVANCHKLPQNHFDKQRLNISTVKTTLGSIIEKITSINPSAKIIFTLSPVRHLKDGFVENQMSKSTLHLAIQDSIGDFQHASYFPSYEILLDDLRDYRFYASDFLHPNALALDYIWEKLKSTYFENQTLQTLAQVDKINKRLSHRFYNPESIASQAFRQKTAVLISKLTTDYPFIKF